MYNIGNIIKNILIIAAVLSIAAIVYLYENNKSLKKEVKIQTENASALRKSDSIRYTNQILSAPEIKEHLVYNDKELLKKLEEANIKINRIQSIITNNYKYKDTVKKEIDFTGLVESIQNKIPKEQPWIDTTQCMTTKGIMKFDGFSLKNVITEKTFNNKSDDVIYWQRKQWKFLFIKSRMFGKKEFTHIGFDKCGESKILKIEKKD